MPPRKPAPSKEEIQQLEPFAGIHLENIFVVSNKRQAGIALRNLTTAGAVGFDTEAKPTFHKGQRSTGPHVFQFSTRDAAYIFQSCHRDTLDTVLEVLKNPDLEKIGFGLDGDRKQIAQKFDITPESMIDLDQHFKKLGYRSCLGVKAAIAMLLGKKFTKSKSTTTSNWAAPRLTDKQLRYAANDAFAAIEVYHAL